MVQRYLKGDFAENPFVHFWAHRHEPGVYGRPSEDEVTVSREVKRFCRPGPYFEELQVNHSSFKPQAMLLAYYLPQFHPFAENDAWWGERLHGVDQFARGVPRFVGHYQPPGAARPWVLHARHPGRCAGKSMAQGGGVYWLRLSTTTGSTERPLEKPVEQLS